MSTRTPKNRPTSRRHSGSLKPGFDERRHLGGRPIGSRNRWNRNVKDAILETFELLDGVDGLVKWARRNPTEFYKGFFKLIPREITGANGQPLVPPEIVNGITRKIIDPKSDLKPTGEASAEDEGAGARNAAQ